MYMLKSLAVMLGLAATHACAEANGATSTRIVIFDTGKGPTEIDVTYNVCATISPAGRISGYKMSDAEVACVSYALPNCQGPPNYPTWTSPEGSLPLLDVQSLVCFRD